MAKKFFMTLLALVGVAAMWAQDVTIGSMADWEAFATAVNNGTSYSGRIVRLTADIGTAQEPITATVGTVSESTQGNAFAGRFIGGGHTIHVCITNTSDQGTAPFRYISGATIEGLKVTGTVLGSMHCAGLVGFAADSTTCAIKNCEVAVSVTCGGDSDSHCGGILGHGLASSTTISNCLFSGSITGTTTATGIIYGWGDDGMHRIENCLSAGDYYGCAGVNLLKKNGGTESIINCYRKTTDGSQGTDASGMSPDELAAALNNGGLEWLVDGDNVVPILTKEPYIQFATITGVTSRNIYTGSAISITPVVKNINGTRLTLGTDFTATLNDNNVASFPFTVTDEGSYTLTFTGTGSYMGSQTVRFLVTDGHESIYIDADGNTAERTDYYTIVNRNYAFGDDNGMATLGVDDDTERWYAIVDTINLNKPLRVEGNARIILCDDALLNINADTTDVAAFYGSGSSLVIYGQAQGTGTLYVYNRGTAISVSDDNHTIINGGTINAIGSDNTLNCGFSILEGGMLTINRGTVNARGTYCGILVQKACLAINGGTVSTACPGGVLSAAIGIIENSVGTINGGNVTATGIDIGWGAAVDISVNTNSTLTFGLTNDSDSITASSYYVGNNSTLRIADGKPLYNGTEDLEPGVVSDLTKLSGKTLTPYITENVVLTASHTTWEHTKTYVLNSDVTISERITVNGAVHLVLGEGCTLHAPKGIELSAGNKLTIYGTGTLNIDGCDTNKSGIGAYSVGTLVINGGTINATGGMYGAGLGGDIHNIGGGSITINNGVVNATGGMRAAGIGGGYDNWEGNYGVCGTIAINGGQVTATGGSGSTYGIGVGYNADGDEEKSGSVVFSWSKITDFIYATGGAGSYSPRIQSMSFAEGKSFMLDGTETVATLSNIEGKKIVPNKYGERYDLTGDGKAKLADLTLLVNVMSREDPYMSLTPTSSGDVVLTSSHTTWENGKTYLLNSDVTIGERITINGTVRLVLGTGCTLNIPKGIELSAGKRLTIDGRGTLNIYNCDYAKSGIGASEVGTLIINGGTLNVTGGTEGAGLGGDSNNTSGGVITINGGVVNATGGSMAAAIGSGTKNWSGDYGICGTITINGGQVTARAGWNSWGIGHGSRWSPFDLDKSGTLVLGWTLSTDFVHAITGEQRLSGFSSIFENFSFADTFLIDGTDVEANSSVMFLSWQVSIGGEESPKIVPKFSDTGLRGDMNGDGMLTPEDVPLMVDAVLYVTDEPVPISSIILSETEMTLDAYGEDAPPDFDIYPTILPRNATNKELEWTTSDSRVAEVYVVDSGKRIHVSANYMVGDCIITATAKDGSGVSATCKVTVFKHWDEWEGLPD